MSARRLSVAVLALALAAGCATVPADGRAEGSRADPWEAWNRKVFAFNEGLDRAVLQPVARGYQRVVPSFVRTAIGNVTGNVQDAWSAVNHLLQGKGESGFRQIVRVGTNTSLGLLGLLDIATEAGIERESEDFGQTLGVWGAGPGIYLVWPVLGPSTLRDTIALPLDVQASPSLFVDDGGAKAGIFLVQLIDRRARLLGATQVLDDIALDKYTFVRDGYLQRRRSQVYDGNPPPSRDEDDADGGTPPAAGVPAAGAQSPAPPASGAGR